MFWKAEVVKVIVLDLEVLAQRNEDLFGLLEVLGCSEVLVVECEGNWEVEGVVCSLVDDNELVLGHGKVVQINLVFWSGKQVA